MGTGALSGRPEAAGAGLTDVVLSSGFLAFAAQAGFLRGVEESRLQVGGVCGTSSGALVGAMWAAGWPAERIYRELCSRPPLGFRRPHPRFWRGVFSLRAVVSRLRRDLPATFSDLERPLGVGVVDAGQPTIITSGDLASAVAASCAIPYVFAPIQRQGRTLSDGGARDRTALSAWRSHRPDADILLHLVDRSGGDPGEPDLGSARVVRSARSHAQLWRLGDTRSRFERTRETCRVIHE